MIDQTISHNRIGGKLAGGMGVALCQGLGIGWLRCHSGEKAIQLWTFFPIALHLHH